MKKENYIFPRLAIFDSYAEFNSHINEYGEHSRNFMDYNIDLDYFSNNLHNFLVIGEPGVGKTELLKHLEDEDDNGNYFDLKNIEPKELECDKCDVLYLDALDEIIPEKVREYLCSITSVIGSKRILLSTRVSFLKECIGKVDFIDKFKIVYIGYFDNDRIKEYLKKNGKGDVYERIKPNDLNIIKNPRYLNLFVDSDFCNIEKCRKFSRVDLFDYFINKDLEIERKKEIVKNNLYHKLLLQKLALIMEMKETNSITHEELIDFLEEIDSNFTLEAIREYGFFKSRSLIDSDIENVYFKNTEFQEYLAAKELNRLGNEQCLFYQLFFDDEISEIKGGCLNLFSFLVEITMCNGNDRFCRIMFEWIKKRKNDFYYLNDTSRKYLMALGNVADKIDKKLKEEIGEFFYQLYKDNIANPPEEIGSFLPLSKIQKIKYEKKERLYNLIILDKFCKNDKNHSEDIIKIIRPVIEKDNDLLIDEKIVIINILKNVSAYYYIVEKQDILLSDDTRNDFARALMDLQPNQEKSIDIFCEAIFGRREDIFLYYKLMDLDENGVKYFFNKLIENSEFNRQLLERYNYSSVNNQVFDIFLGKFENKLVFKDIVFGYFSNNQRLKLYQQKDSRFIQSIIKRVKTFKLEKELVEHLLKNPTDIYFSESVIGKLINDISFMTELKQKYSRIIDNSFLYEVLRCTGVSEIKKYLEKELNISDKNENLFDVRFEDLENLVKIGDYSFLPGILALKREIKDDEMKKMRKVVKKIVLCNNDYGIEVNEKGIIFLQNGLGEHSDFLVKLLLKYYRKESWIDDYVTKYIPYVLRDDLLLKDIFNFIKEKKLENQVNKYLLDIYKNSGFRSISFENFLDYCDVFHERFDGSDLIREFALDKNDFYIKKRCFEVLALLGKYNILKSFFDNFSFRNEKLVIGIELLKDPDVEKEVVEWCFALLKSKSELVNTYSEFENKYLYSSFTRISESCDSGFIDVIDIIQKNADENDYRNYLIGLLEERIRNKKNQYECKRMYKTLKERIDKNSKNGVRSKLDNRLLKRLRESYLSLVEKNKANIVQVIGKYNCIKKNINQNVVLSDYHLWQELIDVFKLQVKALLTENQVISEGFRERQFEFYLKPWIKEYMLQRNIEVDVYPEVESEDRKKVDYLINSGFVGPVVVELKMSDNNETKEKAIGEYKKKMLGYLDSHNSKYGIYYIIRNSKTKSNLFSKKIENHKKEYDNCINNHEIEVIGCEIILNKEKRKKKIIKSSINK